MTEPRTLLHTLWRKAVGTPGYQRAEWNEIESILRDHEIGADDWTAKDGRANSSDQFEEIVEAVRDLIANIRLGDSLHAHAGIIVAQLVHRHGLAPIRGRR